MSYIENSFNFNLGPRISRIFQATKKMLGIHISWDFHQVIDNKQSLGCTCKRWNENISFFNNRCKVGSFEIIAPNMDFSSSTIDGSIKPIVLKFWNWKIAINNGIKVLLSNSTTICITFSLPINPFTTSKDLKFTNLTLMWTCCEPYLMQMIEKGQGIPRLLPSYACAMFTILTQNRFSKSWWNGFLIHYYKMWGQFTSPFSLDQWIHYFFTNPSSLQPVISLKIQWNHFSV